MSATEKIIRILYAAVAFSAALAIHLSSAGAVMAQTNVLRPYNEETQLYNRLDKMEARMDVLGVREDSTQDELGHDEGMAEGAFIFLGILQAAGMIIKDRKKDA